MVIKEESRLKFGFPDKSTVVKFDSTLFYRDYFNRFPNSKGVDFISLDKNTLALIEVKNCTGDEANCRWRIAPDNKKKDTVHTAVDIKERDSLDIEMAHKVAMTLAALCGAKSFEMTKGCRKEFETILQWMSADAFSDSTKKKYMILFLEGDFACRSRSKKTIMKSLQDSINKKLKWLNCQVSVVDSGTYDPKIFQIVS
ncbi:hypothetical protein DXA97_17565 [Clostridium sp. OF09-36]|uniref:DUF6661 family protein n=1 Tax=Clostridium sp. OF09-36 TaxID=2292310 RepID=UPI000E533CB3|nr:DUF6661 family protein [Clostridium sp. OF09-36]RHV84741.1 hypothetical protein DXA97_17565 [Clostridium sp. OF09-36]